MPTMPNARTEEIAKRRICETAIRGSGNSTTVAITHNTLETAVSPFHRFTVSFGFVSLALMLLALPAVRAATSNPYGGIVDRNVFSLKPAPLVDATPAAPPTPPVKLFLNGITTILGNKRALLRAQIPPHPPEPAKEENYMLTEGQRDGGIEVLSIDEHAGIVKVNNNGLTETLDFVNNGAKATALGASMPINVSTTSAQVKNPISSFSNSANASSRGIPTSQSGTIGINEASGQGNGIGTAKAPLQFRNSVSPEDQTLLIEAQRLHLQDQGHTEDAALFPITEITPDNEGHVAPLPQ